MSEAWTPPVDLTAREQAVLKLCRKQKLWSFFRLHRHTLLDDDVRRALAAMYATSGRGKPVCPEQLALAMLLQVAFGVPDHEVPTLTAVDKRWRMVLGILEEPGEDALFSQGTVFHFRARARANGLMRTLLEKTVALARETKGFSDRRLRAMIDSSPFAGAGRVEDSFNLIGRALRGLVEVAAEEAGTTVDAVAGELSLTVVSAASVKAALDVDWRQADARVEALNALLAQVEAVREWLRSRFPSQALATPPLSDAIQLVDDLVEQDTEPDPTEPSGRRRIRQGGSDRRVSIHDADQRHGRKTKTKQFVGYKRHVVVDADTPGLIVAVEVTPANQREHASAGPLLEDVEQRGYEVDELHIDRGYLAAEPVHQRRLAGMRLVSKPPTPSAREGRFCKADFDIDVSAGTVTCPGGHTTDVKHAAAGAYATVSGPQCSECELKERCLPASLRKVVSLHRYEALHQQMAAELATAEGRAARRQRTAVEHGLARLGSIQGRRARYRGLAKNQFHTEACAVVTNCYALNRILVRAA